jgi:hypothetical protein
MVRMAVSTLSSFGSGTCPPVTSDRLSHLTLGRTDHHGT